VDIYVNLAADGALRMAHTSLSALNSFPQCSVDNEHCVSSTTEGNILAAMELVNSSFPLNSTMRCWYHGEDVVFDVDVGVPDGVSALVFPVIALVVGCCIVWCNSHECRSCGGACCLLALSPLYFLFVKGPKALYIRAARRTGPQLDDVTRHPDDPRRLDINNSVRDECSRDGIGARDGARRPTELLPLYDTREAPPDIFDEQSEDLPPAYDGELDGLRLDDEQTHEDGYACVASLAHASAVVMSGTDVYNHGLIINAEPFCTPIDDPPPYLTLTQSESSPANVSDPIASNVEIAIARAPERDVRVELDDDVDGYLEVHVAEVAEA
jgi:hypothetical protein